MSYNNGIEMRVLVNGRPTREYSHKGMSFIESRHGTNYSIKIKNDNAFRVMAIVSVDGLDVITGKPAEESNKGYIVDAYSTTEIKGYRLTDDDSVKFVFVSKDGDKNYAKAATGETRNSGVIGVRIFEEKKEKVKVIEKTRVIEKHIHHHHNDWDLYPKYPWNPYPVNPYPWMPTWYSNTTCKGSSDQISGTTTSGTLNTTNVTLTSGGAGGASCNSSVGAYTATGVGGLSSKDITKGLISPCLSARAVDNSVSNAFDNSIKYDSFDTGTGWGEKQTDKVKKEYFKQGKVISELVLYYATGEALSSMGIDLTDTTKISEMPKPFGNSNYCQPPKDWNG